MFGLGFWEIGIILVIALLVFGPAKLPELARSLGKGLREFRKATDDFRATVSDEMYREPEAQIPPPAPPSVTTQPQPPTEAQVAAPETASPAQADAAEPAAEEKVERPTENKEPPNGVS